MPVPVIETKFENKATSRDLQNLQLVTSRGKSTWLTRKSTPKNCIGKKQPLVRYDIVFTAWDYLLTALGFIVLS